MNFDFFLILFVAFLLGAACGSFLNVIVYRLPRRISLFAPPSCCPACQTRLRPLDLIPLAGYLFLRGRCRHCSTAISPRYPLVELGTALLFTFGVARFGITPQAGYYLFFIFILAAMALIDLEHRIIPNSLVVTGLLGGVMFYTAAAGAALFDNLHFNLSLLPLGDALGGMLLGFGVMLLIYLLSRGGMGAGDLKMMGMIGFFVGMQGVVVVLMIGFFAGALTGLALIFAGVLTRKDAVPFGPFLAAAALIEVFWGVRIWTWYLNLFV